VYLKRVACARREWHVRPGSTLKEPSAALFSSYAATWSRAGVT